MARSRRRCRWTLPALPDWLLPAIVALLCLQSAFVRADEPGDQPLLLEVFVNDHPTGLIGDFVMRDGHLMAKPGELQSLGFIVPPGEAGLPLVELTQLPALTYRIEDETQRLYVTADVNALKPELLEPEDDTQATRLPVETGTGALLNYDVLDTQTGGDSLATGAFDARVFSRLGTATTSFLVRSGGYDDGAIRLDSTYTYPDPDKLRRYRLGDITSSGLTWTRPVRLGGAQVGTDFGLRPDLLTFPIPTVRGQVAVPSSVDVLVNGVEQFRRDVDPGPFEIQNLPIITGSGNVSVVVEDALGRQTVQTLPFYASPMLLKEGLTSYSLEAGLVRRDYGFDSNDYSDPALIGSYRKGVSSRTTLESHAEAGPEVAMAGIGAGHAVGTLGVLSGSLALSGGAEGAGLQAGLGFERITQRLSLNFSATAASPGFADVAAASGDPMPKLSFLGGLGLSLGKLGNLALNYTYLDRHDTPEDWRRGDGTYGASTRQVSLASLTYSIPLRGSLYLYATGYSDLSDSEIYGGMVGFSVALGPRRSLNTSVARDGDQAYASVQASQAAVVPGQFGWQVAANEGDFDRLLAEGEYRSTHGRVSVGADRTNGETATRVGGRGSLAYIDGSLFASDTIQNSFAIVDTSGVGDVGVLYENRDVGHTGSRGRLLVPDLRAYDVNKLGIEPGDVPLDRTLGNSTRYVRPQDSSGIIVTFDTRQERSALLRVVDEDGKALPVGAQAHLEGATDEVPVGYDGEIFIGGLAEHNRVIVARPGQTCAVSFDFKPVPGEIVEIGPLVCR